MRYFKTMINGATLCCIETEIEINYNNVYEVLNQLGFIVDGEVDNIVEVDKEEAFEWYDVIYYKITA